MTTMNTIKVQFRANYGNMQVYATSEHGPFISALTGRKTLTTSDLHNLTKLGFRFEVVRSSVVPSEFVHVVEMER